MRFLIISFLLAFVIATATRAGYGNSSNTVNFAVFQDIDFNGGDIPFATKRDVTLDECAKICAQLSGCKFFTYNSVARVCFPKQFRNSQIKFPGAISGERETQNVASSKQLTNSEFSPLLKKKSCKYVEKISNYLANSASVSFDFGNLKVGSPSKVRYQIPNIASRFPGFVFISFDQPVRFRGRGFYALSPEAKGPFGSVLRKGSTRIVIPLAPKGRDVSGGFDVIPLKMAPISAKVDLFVMTGCGPIERHMSSSTFAPPETSRPVFIVRDEFTMEPPIESWVSPAGDRYIDVYDGFFRLHSTANNTPIREIVARDPRFSPTGRFVTAFVGNEVAVFDTFDGAYIGGGGVRVAWALWDSFFITDLGEKGRADITSSLGGAGTTLGDSCNACDSVSTLALKVDLENSFFLASHNDSGEVDFSPITTAPITRSPQRYQLYKSGGEEVSAAVQAHFGLIPVKLPTHWETVSPLVFTSIRGLSDGDQLDDTDKALVAKFMPKRLKHTRLGASVPKTAGTLKTSAINTYVIAEKIASEFGLSLVKPSARFKKIPTPMTPATAFSGSEREKYQFPFKTKVEFEHQMDCSLIENRRPNAYTIVTQSPTVWVAEMPQETLHLIETSCSIGRQSSTSGFEYLQSSAQPDVFNEVSFGLFTEEYNFGEGGCGYCDMSVEVISSRFIVLWSKGNRAFSIYDRETKKATRFAAFRGRLVEKVQMDSGGRFAVQINSDGTFAIFDLRKEVSEPMPDETRADLGSASELGSTDQLSPALMIMGRVEDDELVAWSPSGHFDGEYEALQQVFLRFPGSDDLFTLDQFSDKLGSASLFQNWATDVQRQNAVTFEVPPIISASIVDAANRELKINLQQIGGEKISKALLYQDGKLTATYVPTGEDRDSFVISSVRKHGTRWISVVGLGKSGLSSAPQAFDLGEDSSQRDLSVIAVAIDDYEDERLPDLNFSKTDAARAISALTSAGAARRIKVEATAIADQSASRAAIINEINRHLKEADDRTDIVLYFAGHGLTDSQGNYFLGLTDTSVDDLAKTGLPWSEVSKALATAKGRVTVILDTCHSGSAGKAIFATNDGLAGKLIASADGGISVLAASKGRQSSIEDSDVGGGLFTSALVDVLQDRNGVYDVNGNGELELSELYRGVKTYVTQKTGGKQTPWYARNRFVGDRTFY